VREPVPVNVGKEGVLPDLLRAQVALAAQAAVRVPGQEASHRLYCIRSSTPSDPHPHPPCLSIVGML
jgi:hypothetical protein